MDGYVPENKVFRIRFTDHPNLLIVAKSISFGLLTKIQSYEGSTDSGAVREIMTIFSRKIVTWNMRHPPLDTSDGGEKETACIVCGMAEGDILPSTPSGMMCLDIDFLMRIVRGWIGAITSVPDPKEQSSNNGGQGDLPGETDTLARLGKMANQTRLPQVNSTAD